MNTHPQQIEEQALDPKTRKYFQEVYDFDRLIKVIENRDRLERFDAKLDRCKKRLRDPLETDENVIALAEHLRKKDAPGRLYKSTTENKTFFNGDRIFTIPARSKTKQQHVFVLAQRKRTKNKRQIIKARTVCFKNQFVE